MRIGEALISEGKVRPEHVEAALRTQQQYGGRLGSLLVELGYLELDELALALAKQRGAPAAVQRHFDALDPSVVRLVPPRTAEAHLSVPLGWSQRQPKTLIVAMVDPRDLHALDELSMVTRARIHPCVAPEARIRAMLSRHYGVRTGSTARFVAVDTSPYAPSEAVVEVALLATPPTPTTAAVSAPARFALSMPPPSQRQAAPSPEPPSPEPPPVSMSRPKSSLPPVKHPSLRPVLTVDEATAAIGAAGTLEEVVTALLDFSAMHLRAAVIFDIQRDAALGLQGFAPFVDREAIESLLVPLASPSVIQLAVERGRSFVGAPPAAGAAVHTRMYKVLRCEPPRQVAVFPILVSGRVAQVLYGHGEDGAPLRSGALQELLRVSAAASEAHSRIARARRSSG